MTEMQKPSLSNGIVLKDVRKSYNGTTVLKELSLSIPPVGVTALLGPSGCGKTTLCHILLGLIKPDSGEIQNPYRKISVAFQDPRLFPWLTAEENAMIALSKIPKAEARDKVADLFSYFGLSDARKKHPEELSGGMQQRVSLIRAFLAPHELLILDEPFRGLDEENKALVIDLIRREAAHSPVLLVTHDHSDVDTLGSYRIVLS